MSDKALQPDFDDELLSAYLDDELAPEQRALVEARLAADPAARQMLDELRHVSETVRGLPQETMRHDAGEAIVRRVEAAKLAAGVHGTRPKFTIGRTRRGWIWASLAVAAGLVIMFVQREPPGEEVGMPLAQRRHEPPALTAAPKSSRPDESQFAAGQLVESESAAPSAAAEGSSVTLGESADRFAAAAPAEPAAPMDENQLVVVHVLAKREALQNKAFDQLLVSNGVRVDPAVPAVDADRTERPNRAVASRVSDEIAASPADADREVDVLLVEASPPTILSCLEDLNKDYANYLGVSVDESAPAGGQPGEADLETRAAKEAPSKKLALDLGKYSRGLVSPQQKARFAPDKAQYFQQAAEGRFAGRGGSLDAVSGAQQGTRLQLRREDSSNQGRAQRLFVAKSADRRLKELHKLALPFNAPTATDPNQLQVLFVLAPGEEPAASPAAENRAE